LVGAEADKSESEGCLSGVNPKGVGSRGEADKSDGSRAQNAKVSGAKKTVKKRYENVLKTKKTTPEEQGARGGKKTVEKRFWISRFAALVARVSKVCNPHQLSIFCSLAPGSHLFATPLMRDLPYAA